MTARFFLLTGAALAAPAAAFATTYLTVPQAQAVMFPGQTLQPDPRDLTDAQVAAIKHEAGEAPLGRKLQAWRAPGGGWFILDQVVGKHEFITYAVALDATGAVKDVEIMEYRETYGGDVRNADWRAQFVGRKHGAKFKLDEDIRNISGATLSCRHIACVNRS